MPELISDEGGAESSSFAASSKTSNISSKSRSMASGLATGSAGLGVSSRANSLEKRDVEEIDFFNNGLTKG